MITIDRTTLTPAAEELLDSILADNPEADTESVRNVLEDGEALASIGVTDDDIEAVEELHQAATIAMDAEA